MAHRAFVWCWVAIATAFFAGPEASADDAIDVHPSCGLEDPSIAENAPAIPKRPGELAATAAGIDRSQPIIRRVRSTKVRGAIASVGRGFEGGALSGKTIYVSPGHGLTWLPGTPGWRTQRGNTNNIVEDFVSVESVGYFVVRHLQNMGAYVVPVRELDTNPARSIIDDSDAGFTLEGAVAIRDGATGFSDPGRIADLTNPFSSGGSKELTASSSQTGAVVWSFDVPEDGEYNVYIAYVQDPTRAPDAHYAVRHAGGESHYRVDQRRHGSTWMLLGRFFFEAGASAEYGAIVLYDDSETAGATLSADAARLGGGQSPFERNGSVSGRPLFEHAARYYTQWSGAPTSVYDYGSTERNNDIGSRPRFAAWEHEDGEDAAYVAWHTNAPNPGTGTSSFAYGPNAFGPASEFSGVPGGLELMTAVHEQLIGDIRAGWDSDWSDRGLHAAYFGEVNPSHNPEMPSALFEIAFHDTPSDADALRDPRFRNLAARAIARGVARYFAERDGATLVLPPDPPTAVVVQNSADGLEVDWEAPAAAATAGDPPSAYRIYVSHDGRGFDDGVRVDGPPFLIEAGTAPRYVRVTSINDGGESLPSAVVGGRRSADGAAQVLVIGGFDRIDGSMLLKTDLSDFAIGTVDRGLIERINNKSYVARFGEAISAQEVSFDSAEATAIDSGLVSLDRYAAVMWSAGEESSTSEPFSPAQRAALSSYLATGGQLFVSGSELAWALDNLGDEELQSFFRDMFRATFVADDAESYDVGSGSGPFAGVPDFSFDDFGYGSYDANFPDVLAADPSGQAVLSYASGAGGTAAVYYETGADKMLLFGFPFETISGDSARADVMAAITAAFDLSPDPFIEIGNPDEEGGCGCRSGGGGDSVPLALALMLMWLAHSRSRCRKSPRQKK